MSATTADARGPLAPMTDYTLMLVLLSEPVSAYRVETQTLERILSRVPGLQHGRRPGDAVYEATERLRVEVCAVLCARACLDRQPAHVQAVLSQAMASAPAPTSGSGGTPVPVNPRRPGPLPPTRLLEPEGAL